MTATTCTCGPADEAWDCEAHEEVEPSYERECPYFARYHNFAGHHPQATCAFGCVEEPTCVTGSWLDDDEFAAVKAEFERASSGSTEVGGS